MKDKKDIPLIVGKTIKEIDNSRMNVIHITFTDDTKISISGEVNRLGIAVITIEDGWVFE